MTTNTPTQQQDGTKIKITERALFQRINRKLGHEDEKICTARLYPGGYENVNLGRYYRIDMRANMLIDTHVGLEELGRNLGVIQPWEQLEADTK